MFEGWEKESFIPFNIYTGQFEFSGQLMKWWATIIIISSNNSNSTNTIIPIIVQLV